MKRALLLLLSCAALLAGCATNPATSVASPKGSGDLGVVIERATGTLAIVDTSERRVLAEVPGLGDLSHASVVFSRDGGTAFVFGRDGALTRVNLLARRIEQRVMQAGNSIGGAVSQDGTLVAAQNYQPGGVKVFDAKTLALVADIPAEYAPGKLSRVVGLADLPGQRFVFALFDADQIWVADLADPKAPKLTKFENIGRQPYDALVTPDGRHYIAGLFGEDGLALIDLWAEKPQVRRILAGYGRANRPPRPWLGLYATEAEGKVVVVGMADEGPAERADLKVGDIVLAVAGQPVGDLAGFFRRVWALGDAGVEVPLAVFRDGRIHELRVASTDRNRLLKGGRLH